MVLHIKMQKRVFFFSVHRFETCKTNVAARWRLPTNFAAKRVLEWEVATLQPLSFSKSQSCAQT